MEVNDNIIVVLARLIAMVRDNEIDVEAFAEDLDTMLDELAYQDAFGTEQQNDPRGDFRNGEFDIWGIEE